MRREPGSDGSRDTAPTSGSPWRLVIAQTFELQPTSATVSGFITGLFVDRALRRAVLAYAGRDHLMGGRGPCDRRPGVAVAARFCRRQRRGDHSAVRDRLRLARRRAPVNGGETADGLHILTVAVVSAIAAAPDSLAPPPDAGVWGAIALTALAATAVGFFVQTWYSTCPVPTAAAVVMTMEPVFAGSLRRRIRWRRPTAPVVGGGHPRPRGRSSSARATATDAALERLEI